MRIAAGVLIIIASVLDLFAGASLSIFGGALAGGSTLVKDAVQKAAEKTKDPEAIKTAQTVTAGGQAIGGGLMVYGLFLLALGGLAIAAAVVLFREKAATFALVVGVLQIIAEVIGLIMVGTIIFNIPGIVAGIFVIIAALGYRGKPTAPVTM